MLDTGKGGGSGSGSTGSSGYSGELHVGGIKARRGKEEGWGKGKMEWEADIGTKEERSRDWGRSRKRDRGRGGDRKGGAEWRGRERGMGME